jgi:hypothetical protein
LGLLEGAFDSVQSMHKDMNRYAALGLDEDSSILMTINRCLMENPLGICRLLLFLDEDLKAFAHPAG